MLDQQPDPPAAALAEQWAQSVILDPPASRTERKDRSRLRHRLMLQLAAADRSREAGLGDDHARARAARRRAFGGENGDQRRGPPVQRLVGLACPVSHCAL
jgi:hypothetical protein